MFVSTSLCIFGLVRLTSRSDFESPENTVVETVFHSFKALCHSNAMLLTQPHPCSMTSAMAATSNSWNTISLSELLAFLLRHKEKAGERFFSLVCF